MKVTVNVQGVDAVFDVKDAKEAAGLVAEIARQSQAPSGDVLTQATKPSDREDESKVAVDDVSDDQIYKALLYMSGHPSAKLLIELTKSENGCTDLVLKEKLGLPKIAAVMSHVTKCCTKAGIPKQSIYTKLTKRIAHGRHRYHYRLTEKAKKAIGEFKDFEKGGTFPDDIDPFSDL